MASKCVLSAVTKMILSVVGTLRRSDLSDHDRCVSEHHDTSMHTVVSDAHPVDQFARKLHLLLPLVVEYRSRCIDDQCNVDSAARPRLMHMSIHLSINMPTHVRIHTHACIFTLVNTHIHPHIDTHMCSLHRCAPMSPHISMNCRCIYRTVSTFWTACLMAMHSWFLTGVTLVASALNLVF